MKSEFFKFCMVKWESGKVGEEGVVEWGSGDVL